jgi:hypothetical protein
VKPIFTRVAVLFSALFLGACSGALQKKVSLDPELTLDVNAELLELCPVFEKRDSSSLTESQLIAEYSRLSTSYNQCFNRHHALRSVILKLKEKK